MLIHDSYFSIIKWFSSSTQTFSFRVFSLIKVLYINPYLVDIELEDSNGHVNKSRNDLIIWKVRGKYTEIIKSKERI